MSKVTRPLNFHTCQYFHIWTLIIQNQMLNDLRRVGKNSCPDHLWLRTPGPLSSAHERHTPSRTGSRLNWPAGAGTGTSRGTPSARWGQASIPMGLLTWHMDVPEAGEREALSGHTPPGWPRVLHGFHHLLICHLQGVLRLSWPGVISRGGKREG